MLLSFLEYNQEKKQVELPGCLTAWTVFMAAAVVQLLWLVFGSVFGSSIVILDPIVLGVFGLICAQVVFRRRSGRGIGLSVRGTIAIVAFLASVFFVLTRFLGGVGDTSRMSLGVTVRDASTGRPIEGALVTASDGHKELARDVTDERGRVTLEYEFWIWTDQTWTFTRRFEPEVVMVDARADSYDPERRVLRQSSRYRLRFVDEPFKSYPPRRVSSRTEMQLDREDSSAADVGIETDPPAGTVPDTVTGPGGYTDVDGTEIIWWEDPPEAAGPARPVVPIDDELLKQVTVTTRLTRHSFLPLEPIVVGFEVHNPTPYSLGLEGPEGSDTAFAVEVRDEAMREVPKSAYYRAAFERSKEPMQMNGPAPVFPRTSATRLILANWPYDMTAPGVYSVAVRLTISATPTGGGDPHTLEIVCDPIVVKVSGDPVLGLTRDELPVPMSTTMMGGHPPAVNPVP